MISVRFLYLISSGVILRTSNKQHRLLSSTFTVIFACLPPTVPESHFSSGATFQQKNLSSLSLLPIHSEVSLPRANTGRPPKLPGDSERGAGSSLLYGRPVSVIRACFQGRGALANEAWSAERAYIPELGAKLEGLAKLNSERPGRHIVCTAVRDIKSPRGASWAPHTQSAQAIWTPRGL